MIFANLAGLPALAMPAGSVLGLPAGVQLAAAPHSDELLLAVGKAFQEVTPFASEGKQISLDNAIPASSRGDGARSPDPST
jgi:aspartyl-tRNA(Asn)/glutamyl-tRNA(Gln) amidotransferase subunit A